MPSKGTAIYEAILALVPDLLNLRAGDYRRFKSAGFMDLHLDVLAVKGDCKEKKMHIALAHNYRHQSGDIIPDPDMEIRIYPERRFAEAMSYQDIYTYRVVYADSGVADVREQSAQNDFLLTWLANIRAQGFVLTGQKSDED